MSSTTPQTKSTKSKKANNKGANQKNMEWLEKEFKKVDVAVVWNTFKSHGYDLQATVIDLCKQVGRDPETVTLPVATKTEESTQKSSDEEVEKKKAPRKTADEVFARIKWDKKFNPEEVTIGYLDRFDGLKETAFSVFDEKDVSSETFIPWHRVQFFKQNETMLWDRRTKLDLLSNDEDPSNNTTPTKIGG
jgi:uncharacterized protein (UPF0248 family)